MPVPTDSFRNLGLRNEFAKMQPSDKTSVLSLKSDVEESDDEILSTKQNFDTQGDIVPFPRLCGAVFGANGIKLLYVNF